MASVEYLVKNTDVPFEEMELLGLKVMKQLLNWEWGMKALFSNSVAIAYLLTRVPKTKSILELKFKIIEKTVNSRFFLKQANVIDSVIGEQIEVFYQGGVYGIQGSQNYVPEYASKNMWNINLLITHFN